jgi:Flp pilus assembly protein TadD
VLSTIELGQGDFEAAVERLEQVLDEFPEDVQARNDLGYLWADRGMHLARSQRMIEYAVAASPDNAAYRDSLGWVLFRLGRYPEAIEQLQRAVAGTEDEPDGVIMDHLGDAYDKAGRREEALAAWRRAEAVFQNENDRNKLDEVRKKLIPTPLP